MPKVRVGLVGCGFVSELHMYAYKRVYGLEAEVSAVAHAAPTSPILPKSITLPRRTETSAT